MKKTIKSSITSTQKPHSADTTTSQRFLEAPGCIRMSYFWGADDHIDAADWMEIYDNISTDHNWTATNKIIRLGGYLRKHALSWYVQTMKNHPVEHSSWTVYKDLFVKRFNPNFIERVSSSRSSESSSISR